MKQIVFQGSQWQIAVSNGTQRTLTLDTDGQLYIPSNVNIANAGGFKGSISSSALTADRNYTLPNRAGTIALQDSTSLAAMLPSDTGLTNYFLQTNGAGVFTWATSAVTAITSLNGNTSASQTLTVLATGTALQWTKPDGNTVQLGIPMAATATVAAGLVSKAQYDNFAKLDATAGNQTFANAPYVTTPSTNLNALATYGQVLASRASVTLRYPVKCIDISSTSRPTVSPQIDGVTVLVGDRVLFTALSVGGENNRIYKATVSTNPVTWVLETDGPAGDGSPTDGDLVFCQQGTARADQQWAFNGTSWILYNRSAAYTFSTGLSFNSGTNFVTVDFAPSGTSNATQAVRADDSRLSDSRTPTSHSITSHSSTNTAGQLLLGTGVNTYGWTSITGDISFNGSGVSALANIPSGVTAAGSILFTAIAAPGTPAAGKGSVYIDSTSKNICVKDDAGVVKHGVQTKTAVANNFVTQIAADGAVTTAQPSFSNLSGSIAASQLPAFTGDATSTAGTAALSVVSATLSDAVTATASTVFSIVHNSTGTAAAGFGSITKWQLESSTTNSTDAADDTVSWVVATHASRTARKVFNIYDTAVREAMRIEASGTAAMIGFLGANASARLVSPDVGTALVTFGLASGTPTFAAANLSGQVAISAGGTGQATKTAAYDALSPNTTAGDFTYRGASNNIRLAGNATATKQFLSMTSSVPSWGVLAAGDIPSLAASIITSGSLVTARGGTGESVTLVKYIPVSNRLPVRVVAVTNVVVASPGASIDGFTLGAGDRVLLTNQTTTNQNGIWIWNGAATPMTRPEDYASGSTTQAYVDVNVLVTNGTAYAGTEWRQTATGAITIDTTTTTWSQLSFSISSGVAGILGVANGGTGANLAATGGVNQVLMQTSVGGAVSVAQLGFSNLSGSVTASQMPALTGDATTAAGSTAVSVVSSTLANAATNTADTVFTIAHSSSATPVAGFGSTMMWNLETSTTADIAAASDVVSWVVPTHGSQTARRVFNIYDTAAREAMRIEASGTAARIGFLGATAALRQTGDIGTALVTFGLMSGTPTFAAANISGTLPISAGGTGLSSTSQSFVFIGPSGSAGAPTWRALVTADLPNHNLVDTTKHPISGKTAGMVLLATAATTYDFVAITGDLSITGAGVASIAQVGGVAVANLGLVTSTATLADNTAAATVVTGLGTLNGTSFRSVVIEYQISRGAGNYATGHLVLLFDGTSTRLTQIEQDSVGTTGVTFTADYSSPNMRLLYQTTSTGTACSMYFRIKTFPV